MMKSLFYAVLLLSPLVSHAGLYDERNRAAYAREQEESRVYQEEYAVRVENETNAFIERFGRAHDGIRQREISGTHFEILTGDNLACKGFTNLSDFNCFDGNNVVSRYWSREYRGDEGQQDGVIRRSRTRRR